MTFQVTTETSQAQSELWQDLLQWSSLRTAPVTVALTILVTATSTLQIPKSFASWQTVWWHHHKAGKHERVSGVRNKPCGWAKQKEKGARASWGTQPHNRTEQHDWLDTGPGQCRTRPAISGCHGNVISTSADGSERGGWHWGDRQ